jgi:type II secretory ATPase GspE/PulE/Tfp pilus assembly ATPase PilB-like protein
VNRALAIVSLLLCGILALGIAPVCAQENAANDGTNSTPSDDANGTTNNTGNETQNPAPATNGSRAAGQFPPLPSSQAFSRGNVTPDPDTPAGGSVGFYVSMWRFFLVFGVFLIWTSTGDWVNHDSTALKVRPELWNSLVFSLGVVGFLVALSMPMFFIGLLVIAMTYSVPVGMYVAERNAKVPPASRVLTPDHIKKVLIRNLAKIGIHIGSESMQEQAIGPDIVFIGKSETGARGSGSRSRQVESSRGFLAAKELVYDALLRRCTDIHLEPADDQLNVRMRIDGVMYPVEPFDRAMGDAIINIFKVLGAMDITEKRKSLDGSFRAIADGREIDFRVATQGTRQGQKLSLRILDQANAVSTLQGLGLRKKLAEELREIIHQPHGMLLVCGPTGAGKSTTLFASISDIDSYQRNIITVEDPIEYKMENVTQIEINTRSGQTFATSLRSILRQDPDVVMIGEIRDQETAVIACQAANTGHMVFSTVHANDTITALYRMIDLGVEPFQLSSSLTGILAQRLARRLCVDCREAYRPNPEMLKKAGLPVERIDKFYRPPKSPEGMCGSCGGLGYRGRVGVFELLSLNDRMRDLIRDSASVTQIKSEARKNGMLYMKEEGLRLVVRGVTSIEELLRVVK